MWTRRSEKQREDVVRQRFQAVWPRVQRSSPGAAAVAADGVLDDDEVWPGAAAYRLDPAGEGAWSGPAPGVPAPGVPGPGRDRPGPTGAGGTPDADPAGPVLAGGRAALGAFDPGRRGLRALLVVAAVVVVVAGYLFWRGQPRVEPAPAAPAAVSASGDGGGQDGGGGAPAATIVVAVTGRVVHPGLVRLPDGARVQDALAAAGGVLPGTDISFLNLARKLTDGELLVVGVTPPPDAAGGGVSAGVPGSGKVNINTGTLAELDTLPGIGPALAQRIIDYRTAHGSFRSVDDLRKVSGIGDAKFAEIKDRVTV